MANIPYPNIPYPRLSCWWVLNLFCDKRYQITFKIQVDDIYIFVQCGGHVLQHLICIKIGTVRSTHRLVSSLLQGRLNRSCQDERTASALTTILPILFLYLNTVTVTAGTFKP